MMGSQQEQGAGGQEEELSDEALLESMDINKFWKEGQRRAGDGGSASLHKPPFTTVFAIVTRHKCGCMLTLGWSQGCLHVKLSGPPNCSLKATFTITTITPTTTMIIIHRLLCNGPVIWLTDLLRRLCRIDDIGVSSTVPVLHASQSRWPLLQVSQ